MATVSTLSNVEPRLAANASARAPQPVKRATAPPRAGIGTPAFQQLITPSHQGRSRLARYGVAVLSVGISIALRRILGRVVEDSGPFLFFTPAVIISAWYGGIGPGILATVASIAAADY